MSTSISCPHCGKRFAGRPELIGRRVRCPKCQEPFTAELDPDLAPVPAAAPPPPRAPTAAPRPAPIRSAPSAEVLQRRAEYQAAALRIGRRLVVLGALALVLPYVGLQLRLVQGVGVAPATAAVIMILFGGTLWAAGATDVGGHILDHFTRWGVRLIKAAAILLLVILLLIVALPFVLPYLHGSGGSASSKQADDDAKAMASRFGKSHVLHIRVSAPTMAALQWGPQMARLRATLTDQFKAQQQRVSSVNNQGDVYAAPVDDVDGVATALRADGWRVSAVDASHRTITAEITSIAAQPKSP